MFWVTSRSVTTADVVVVSVNEGRGGAVLGVGSPGQTDLLMVWLIVY